MPIRPYQPTDLPSLYQICLLTGNSGEDATGLYDHPDLLGAFFAAPYAVLEPDLAFVLEDAEGLAGYIIGTRDSHVFADRLEREWLPTQRLKFSKPSLSDSPHTAWVKGLIHTGYTPYAAALEYPAHLHVDLLPRAQGHGQGKILMHTFLERLREFKVPGVHLGVGIRNARAIAFYEKLGFQRLETHEFALVYGLKL